MYRSVNPESVVRTVARLRDRIRERFPESGLAGVSDELYEVAQASAARATGNARPLLPLRIAMAALVVLIQDHDPARRGRGTLSKGQMWPSRACASVRHLAADLTIAVDEEYPQSARSLLHPGV